MTLRAGFLSRLTTTFIYGRVPLAFGGLVCALAVVWGKNPFLYALGVSFLFISMGFDIFSAWAVSRNLKIPPLAHYADRIMDKLIYSIIFPAISAGAMWRLYQGPDAPSNPERLHAIFILILCIAVLIRDNFAHFMRDFSIRKGDQPESRELTTLRIMVAAPVAAVLYGYAFYIPGLEKNALFSWLALFDKIPLRVFFIVEIIFLVINFGSMARFCKKYGTLCLDEVCMENDRLRIRILSFFPNTLTVMNAVMGLLSVFFAYQGRIQEAFLIVIGAAFFDKLDGAVARKLGLVQQSDPDDDSVKISLGGILDDIADAVSFCICPGWIFYIVFTDPGIKVGFPIPASVIAIFYAVMGIARLVYFTLDKTPIPGKFKGLPTPGAALIVLAPILIFYQGFASEGEVSNAWAIFCSCWMVIIGFMMNLYPVHYLHMGRFMDQKPKFAIVSSLTLFAFIFTDYFGYAAFALLLAYLASPFVAMISAKK